MISMYVIQKIHHLSKDLISNNFFINRMNGFVLVSLALVVIVANVAEASTLTVGSPSVEFAAINIADLIPSSSSAPGFIEGLVLLKSLVFGAALAAAGGKRKRSVDDNAEDATFEVLNKLEPDQCYKRLICDLAAGAIPDEDNIVALFDDEVWFQSPKFEYANAAKIGKIVKQSQVCEIRYSCPLSTQEIEKLFY